MWFKKKEVKETQQSSLDAEIDKIRKLMDELVEESKAGVLRTDMLDAYLLALIDLHPECQKHPKVAEYMERVKNYRESKKRN